ncbi:hypothetical protein [Stenotrophomonas sp. MMGLT7]|uniref:hypothetical protein n=1 Tax=Stenotrophomonas sp. MMGLT7 TaxID=2901227 RepID=UPI001E318097|nr:hypothetical protein [Stenotrophomonas sp. MMGLT7]MCD7099637.1 hypothetical protein [Stenotrophomonas sp. MMGLT7]
MKLILAALLLSSACATSLPAGAQSLAAPLRITLRLLPSCELQAAAAQVRCNGSHSPHADASSTRTGADALAALAPAAAPTAPGGHGRGDEDVRFTTFIF